MDPIDWLTLIAIVISPLLAVQATRYLDNRREIRNRKLAIYRTLMATRGSRLSPDHVQALNSIDIEFNGSSDAERKVRLAWKAYLDHLSTEGLSVEQFTLRSVELFVDLLDPMGRELNYDFDKTHLKNAAYSPKAHGELELDQIEIRRGLREFLEGNRVIPMTIVEQQIQAENPEK